MGLDRIAGGAGIHVFFENPRRVHKTLAELAEAQPQRPAAVCRELTKLHEEIVRGTLRELSEWASDGVRGEVTVVVGPMAQEDKSDEHELREALSRCLAAGLSSKDSSAAVAAIFQVKKKPLYQGLFFGYIY